MMAKPKSADYKNGYGACKADLLQMIQEALSMVHNSRRIGRGFEAFNPSEEDKVRLRIHEAELQRIRAMVRALKPKE